MYLTREEERALDGFEGEAKALAMKVVVRVGEVLGAEKLVPIKNAHISGISYKNIGEEGLAFIEKLAGEGARFSVPTTLNPGAFDLAGWQRMNVDEKILSGQLRIIDAFRRMGAAITLSCTPYLYANISYGDHLAWSESNAVLYANSVVGARTNRDGGPLALFEAIAGRAPLAGLHLEENRRPMLLIDFSSVGEKVVEKGIFSAAGLAAGRIAGASVPLVKGLRFSGSDELKLFLAAAGATGGTGLVLVDGISPDLRFAKWNPVEGVERVGVEWSALQEELERYSGSGEGVVVLGCPHLSPSELKDIISWLRRHGRPKRRLILFTSRAAVGEAEKRAAEEAGAELFTDTCMVVSELSKYAGREFVTDSGKAAFYLASQGYLVKLLSRGEALRYALGGSA
ncbi:MAG: aconitase X catalytic domain-containing protein [Thermofilum sp.]